MAQSQSTRQQPVRAGVVILESAKAGVGLQPMSAAPHAWYNLHSDRLIKPVSWNIYNPNASSVLSAPAFARWSVIDAAGTPPVGTRLTKQHAAYWEVFLNQMSDDSMSNYDVLLLNPANYASLSPSERERLRKFVDQGGLLWIDAGALRARDLGVDLINNFPTAFMLEPGPPTGAERSDFTQPLLSSPNPMTGLDVSLLNTSIDPGYATNMTLAAVDLGGDAALQNHVGAVSAQFSSWQPATLLNNMPTMSVGRIGDGVMVVTSRGASMKLNRTYGVGLLTNIGFMARNPVLDRDGIAAAKLAVNMISMLTEFRQGSGGSRKTGSSSIDVGAPLLRRSTVPASVDSAPTIYKGMVVAVVGNRIVAYDADPYRDLDGDGNPDDGYRDLGAGAVEDVVWMSAPLAATPISSPVCAEVPDSVGAPRDQVLVVDGNGTMHAYNMIIRVNGAYTFASPDADNRSIAYSVAPASGSPLTGGTPFSPTVHEGFAYVADSVPSGPSNRGRIWIVDLASGTIAQTGGREWVLGGGASPVQIPELTASATVGNIPIADNSGGIDRVLYVPFAPSSAGVPSAGFIGIWLGARGEKPSDYEPKAGNTGTALIVTTRASQQGGLPIYMPGTPSTYGVKVSLLDAQGQVMSVDGRPGAFGGVGMNDIFDAGALPTDLGGGVISFPFLAGVTSLPPQVVGVRVDYTIDIGTAVPGVLAAIERGRINLPDTGPVGARRVNGPVALSPGGTIWVTTQRPGNLNLNPNNPSLNRGGVYAFKEEGRGLFKMTARWEMYRDHTIARNGGERINHPSTLTDNDPFRAMMQGFSGGNFVMSGNLTNFRVVGPPVIRNGQTYVAVGATELSTVPVFGAVPMEVAIVLAFRAESEVPTVQVGDLPNGTILIQQDVARSTNLASPEMPSVLAGANYSYDRSTGKLRIENLATVQKGVIQNSLSLSQPLIIRKPGQPDAFLEPNAVPGAKWSPLLWYSVLPGIDVTATSNPLVATGDTLFLAGRSRVPRFLTGTGFAPTGIVQAIRTDVSSGNPFLATDPQRSWLNQFGMFSAAAAANPGYLWPQLRGVTSIQDFIVRLNQATLAGPGAVSQTARGVVAGDGALIAWGDAGLYTFSRSDFLVVDEGRVGTFDPAGNVMQTLTAIGASGATGNNAGNVRPLVKPSRAYRITGGGSMIVDTGSNRVSLIDTLGNETRAISEFVLDPNHVPSGFVANESLSLNSPTDVLTYTSYRQRPAIDSVVTPGDGMGAGAYEFWVHYLIADGGNKRLVEIVDRYRYNAATAQIGNPVTVTGADGIPRSQVGVLVWHSPAEVSGKEFTYTSVSRAWLGPAATGRWVYIAGTGGLPTRVDLGLDSPVPTTPRETRDGNGGVVIFDPNNPQGTSVINRVNLPAIGPNVFWNDSTGTFNSAARNATDKYLGNVASVTTRPVSTGVGTSAVAIMIADGSGVYEALYDGTPGVDVLPVQWMLPNEAYRVLRRNGAGVPIGANVPLRATFARRLDNGDILLVNGFYGPRRDGQQVGGEILQLVGTPNALASPITAPNLGFGLLSITFELPPVEGSRGLVLPVFADRK